MEHQCIPRKKKASVLVAEHEEDRADDAEARPQEVPVPLFPQVSIFTLESHRFHA